KELIANDISSAMIDIAQRQVSGDTVVFTKDDATVLRSFRGKKFGTIISSNLFYYIKDKEKAIRRWKNLLTKNGRVIFIEEYPFIQPHSDFLEGKKSGLTSIILPVSPSEIE